MEYCISVNLRFCLNQSNKIEILYNAFTLYSANYMEVDQLYLLFMVTGEGEEKTIQFSVQQPPVEEPAQKEEKVMVHKTSEDIISSLQDRMGLHKAKLKLRHSQYLEVFHETNLGKTMSA
jgi:hypothetical protein